MNNTTRSALIEYLALQEKANRVKKALIKELNSNELVQVELAAMEKNNNSVANSLAFVSGIGAVVLVLEIFGKLCI